MNTKVSSIAVTASLLLSGFIAGLCQLIFHLYDFSAPWYVVFLIWALTFLVTGIVFRLLYQRYIFANLLNIYRNIIRLRYPDKPVKPVDRKESDITSEINQILVEWSNESREEIDHLKQVETYRREFLSNVSHELKTPIFSIQGYVHTLIDGGIDDPDVNHVYLERASKGIDRIISMVEDLESISKLEAGELILEPRTFDLAELAREVFDSLEFQAKDRKIQFGLSTAGEKPYYVYADKDLVRQVLVNLIVNSIKYGKSEGRTEVLLSDDDSKVYVEVKDDGLGIEKSHLPRLFERFYRVDKSRSREQGGTGLGLSIVKHIIEAHNQKISVSSEPGVGTVFTFTLRKSK